MGMAASQARYLGLTARKTNTEFEGQQVNQQRMALANQSANLFSQLMALNVPVPPSTDQFTTIKYNYNDGLYAETITSQIPLVGDQNYNYTVTHQHTESVYTAVEQIRTDPQVTEPVADTYWIGNLKTTAYAPTTDSAAVSKIASTYPDSNIAEAYNGTGGHTTDELRSYTYSGKTYYTCVEDLEDSLNSGTNPQANLDLYYASNIDKAISKTEKAYIENDSSGRLKTINLESTPSSTFDLTTTTVTDENAYKNAMNQYTYNSQLYQKQIEDINAKTKVIQQEDRTLELRLKQLDTEQEALSTEMDSVKKVIDKNIEQTFKTFQ